LKVRPSAWDCLADRANYCSRPLRRPGKPSEAITREQAVGAYTLGSAYAGFAENDRGSLATGKLADLAVLSQDIFPVPAPELPQTESVLTMLGGKIVYDAKALSTH
jgi:predicted amidohydrolase YtcJ